MTGKEFRQCCILRQREFIKKVIEEAKNATAGEMTARYVDHLDPMNKRYFEEQGFEIYDAYLEDVRVKFPLLHFFVPKFENDLTDEEMTEAENIMKESARKADEIAQKVFEGILPEDNPSGLAELLSRVFDVSKLRQRSV